MRSKGDPYAIYAETAYNLGRDLTVFFWLSMVCLGGAFLSTVALFVMWGLIVNRGKRNREASPLQFA